MGETRDIRDKRGVVMAGCNDNSVKCLLLIIELPSSKGRYIQAICDSQLTFPFGDPHLMKSNEHATFAPVCILG